MAKSFEEVNRIFAEKHHLELNEKTGGKKLVSNIAFYGALIVLVLLYSTSGNRRNLFGFSYYNILTSSMQSTIPRGSFVLVRATPGGELQVGDNITFLRDANTIVTRRIIEIYENYDDSGQYAFRTQRTDNPSPDPYITYEGNIIGKVIFHVPALGFVMDYIAQHFLFVAFGFEVLLGLSFCLKIVFSPEKEKAKKDKTGKDETQASLNGHIG